jgi:thioredoxin-disulfide reductase
MYDVIILGASAAGASAAIYLARRNINFKMLGFDFGGEMALSGEVGNYPGFGMTNGVELSQKFSEHLKVCSIKPELGSKVSSLEKQGHLFIVKFNGSEYRAKSIILATGAHPRELGVPGEKELRGKGLSYCTVCDGPLFQDKNVVIIGGGDSASEAGIMMNEIARQVHVLTINPEMKGDASLMKRLSSLPKVKLIPSAQTTKVTGNGFVSGVEYKDLKTGETKTIQTEGVFVHIGMIPNTDFVKIPELNLNELNEIVIDKSCQTNVPGLFACGDLTDIRFKQIGIAVGQGICAALSSVDYLNKL